ncbi:hypothetical protein CLOM_g3644 [Closterium sp. NIES-68]|nr:hypothetical protein CLOM_g3644 [Closterium sp. NIES-68]GJP66556.1 hypothetical protein CLOP_g23476 [Closterium sp. NIES-67]
MADKSAQRQQPSAAHWIGVSSTQASSLSSDKAVSRGAAAFPGAEAAPGERKSSAEVEAARAEGGTARGDEGTIRAKELSLQLERLLADSNPFRQSLCSSSDDNASSVSLSPISSAQSVTCGGSASGNSAQRRKAASATVTGAGNDAVSKKGAGDRQRRRRKSALERKGKKKSELCPCGCARLVQAEVQAEQQRQATLRKAQSQSLINPTSARLFGQRSATATCPFESPFLDSLVRSIAHDASNGDVADSAVSEAGKSRAVECRASDSVRDGTERCNARGDGAGDTNGSGNHERVAATEVSGAGAGERKSNLCAADSQLGKMEGQRAGSDGNEKRREESVRRKEHEATSQHGSLRLETPTKTKHFDRSMAVARWVLSPVNPYSSGRPKSSSHIRTSEDGRSSSGVRSEPATRPPSGGTKSVSARRDLSGSFAAAARSQHGDSHAVVSEPASRIASARTDESSSTRSIRYKDSTPTSSGRNNVVNNIGETSDVTRQCESRDSKPPKWKWLQILSSTSMPWSQHPKASQPSLVS